MLLEIIRYTAERILRGQGFRREFVNGISAFRGGFGEPIVLLHGALSHGATTWFRAASPLARRFHVIVPDLPGFGASRDALPEDEISVRGIAARLLEVLPDLTRGRRAVLVGESLGGWIAARLTLSDPACVEHLLLVDAAGHWRDEAAGRALAEIIVPETRETLQELYRRVTGRNVRVPEWAARDIIRTYQNDYAGLRRLIATAEGDVLTDDELSGMLNRVAVIWGEHDALIPPREGRALADAIPGATWDQLPGCAHTPPIEKPGRFVNTVVQRVIGARK